MLIPIRRDEPLQGAEALARDVVAAVDQGDAGLGEVDLQFLVPQGSVREHVQRLGRLLRKHGDKQALLYEVVTRATAEEYTSQRRRQHQAYE